MLRWHNYRRGKEGHGALTRWFISRDMESTIWLEVRSQFHKVSKSTVPQSEGQL